MACVAFPATVYATSRSASQRPAALSLRDRPASGRRPADDAATDQSSSSAPSVPSLLAEARAGFTTQLTADANSGTPAPAPPPTAGLTIIEYPSTVGNLVAYLTSDPKDGRRHPAIIWIAGGDTNTIDNVWTPQPADNDQTASAYRKAGIVMMYPSQRGGNTNPGHKEGFLGECDDVLAAARFLAAQPYVDPHRIYLGGHSTGGTLALLVAELPNPFRAVFVFGPATNPVAYQEPTFTPFDTKDPEEVRLRSPGNWLTSVQTPTWVLEGTKSPSNITSLRLMSRYPHDRNVRFVALKGKDHFSELRPTNALLARAILADTSHASFKLQLP
jgi:dipeptidyl aminopeptidase/acylaminoacyl peptidase